MIIVSRGSGTCFFSNHFAFVPQGLLHSWRAAFVGIGCEVVVDVYLCLLFAIPLIQGNWKGNNLRWIAIKSREHFPPPEDHLHRGSFELRGMSNQLLLRRFQCLPAWRT